MRLPRACDANARVTGWRAGRQRADGNTDRPARGDAGPARSIAIEGLRERMDTAYLAVDWSGAMSGERSKIWLAEVRGGTLLRLECGRSREELVDDLVSYARRHPSLVVGLDFAFSLPEWFIKSRGLRSAAELWTLVERECEGWLAGCVPPFWGRPGYRRPALSELPESFRRTERSVESVAGIRPKSVFQIGGAGAVGTGSLRGMAALARLRAGGFSIWPFDQPIGPVVVEIYPRLLTGPVVKSSAEKRDAYLSQHYRELDRSTRMRAARSDDAFDAAISALVMAKHGDALASLPSVVEPQLRREGIIWYPGWRESLLPT